jgi:hypothetical protein
VAAETGIVMLVYLDEAFTRSLRDGRIHTPADVDAAVVEGAAARVRPLVMTVATTVLGLLPLLWESGIGADVSARTAAPVVGGLWSCMLLTLLVLPAAYAIWRRHQVRVAHAVVAPRGSGATSEGSSRLAEAAPRRKVLHDSPEARWVDRRRRSARTRQAWGGAIARSMNFSGTLRLFPGGLVTSASLSVDSTPVVRCGGPGTRLASSTKDRGGAMATLAISRASEQLLSAIRVEYTRMPGMRLTRAQFRRLWQLDAGACDEALRRLMGDGFLIKDSEGQLHRALSGGVEPCSRVRRAGPAAA